jgi:hypothetical protein
MHQRAERRAARLAEQQVDCGLTLTNTFSTAA